jgi:hypothetical protein
MIKSAIVSAIVRLFGYFGLITWCIENHLVFNINNKSNRIFSNNRTLGLCRVEWDISAASPSKNAFHTGNNECILYTKAVGGVFSCVQDFMLCTGDIIKSITEVKKCQHREPKKL